MLDASLGDEQNEEDPTVLKLQERATQKLGKETALFVALFSNLKMSLTNRYCDIRSAL